jgi:tryptophan 2-monooxygenase
MAILPNLRTAAQCPPNGTHPYIDTPDFMYDAWLNYLGAQSEAIGSVPPYTNVAVIGGGVSGLCAALELQRAGCSVTVFEAGAQVGGRCASFKFGSDPNDIAELGSMRFPPTEFLLNHYLITTGLVPGGLCSLPDFPDPCNTVPTYICYKGQNVVWQPNNPLPPEFSRVAKGWTALMQNGVTKGQATVFPSAGTITNALASNFNLAATYWQQYINRFGQMTFYGVLFELFSGKGISGYDIPGGQAWTNEDFTVFGELGVGSGGFGPLYPISFLDIFRLIVNELETTQKFLRPSSTVTDGIRSLPLRLAAQFQSMGGSLFTSTTIQNVIKTKVDPPFAFTLFDPFGNEYPGFQNVIVATTTRAMELTTDVTTFGSGALLSADVVEAIMRTHIVSSNKVAALIPNYWSKNPTAARVLLTDNMLHQIYVLDYTPQGAPEDTTGVCFITYVWDDDAVKQQSLTSGAPDDPADNTALYAALLNALERSSDPNLMAWAQNLIPLNNDYVNNVQYEEWQSKALFGGAFKLTQPGEDVYVQTMFFDYQKCTNKQTDTGLYIAGDCIAWTSGWVEGALQTALNAACGVIVSAGGKVNGDANNRNPLSIIPNRYDYSGTQIAEPAIKGEVVLT